MIKEQLVNDLFNWVQISDPTEEDKNILRNKYHIKDELLYYACDPHERPRLERDEDNNYWLIIYDVDVQPRFSGDISTEPIGILISNHMLFTFTRERSNYVIDQINQLLANNSVDNPHSIMDLVFELLYHLTTKFFDHINNVNSQRTHIQQNLIHSANRSAITQLLNLQTSLVYFLTALSSNNDLLENIERQLRHFLSENQLDRLDDITIEAKQGLTMAQISSRVTKEVTDAYSNVLDSNLNTTMKVLTVFSIMLTIPNLVFSFYGENVSLPFMNHPNAWILTLVFAAILSFIAWWFYHKNL